MFAKFGGCVDLDVFLPLASMIAISHASSLYDAIKSIQYNIIDKSEIS